MSIDTSVRGFSDLAAQGHSHGVDDEPSVSQVMRRGCLCPPDRAAEGEPSLQYANGETEAWR